MARSFTLPEPAARRAVSLIRRHVLNPALPWERQRARMAAAMVAAHHPKGVEKSDDIVAGVPVEVLTPKHQRPTGTLVHVHGGGFTVGAPVVNRAWAGALCERLGLEVIQPAYRLAPEHPFPAGLDDVTAVLGEILQRFDPATVALSGDSAGANLAMAATQRRIRDGGSLPAALVLLSPWLDLTYDRLSDPNLLARDPMLNPEWLAASATAYAPGQLENPEVSPIFGELVGLPPVFIQGGSDDILAPDAERLTRALAPLGEVSLSVGARLWHDFSLQVGMLKAADQALEVTVDHLVATLALAVSD